MKHAASILALLALTSPALAASPLTLNLPGAADRTAEQVEPSGSYQLPVGPYRDGTFEAIRAEGAVRQEAWQTVLPGASTMDLLTRLRTQLEEAGFDLLYECATEDCGGFDFRFAADLIGEPHMHVDLGDFRYLSARRTDDETAEFVSLLVSRSRDHGYVHLTHVSPAGTAPAEVAVSTKGREAQAAPVTAVASGDLADALAGLGMAALDDLRFTPGSSELGDGEFASLVELAAYLSANPGHTVALVGHTDFAGGLDGNVALSRKRAASVRDRLVENLGVNAAQVTAEGVGYLSPRSTNLTEEGRAENRRVEVVLTSTQ